MKKRFCNLFIILFSTLFFVLTSGVVITLHECCQKHQHTENEHNHCHETKILLKIKGEFTKSETVHFSFPAIETELFFSVFNNDNCEIQTPHFYNIIPPLIKLAGVDFVNFTSQRVFYS